jgi:glutamate-1-semialdehyde aminotransferase
MATVDESGLFHRMFEVTPGASQTRSKAPGHVGPPIKRGDLLPEFPLFARHGVGPMLMGSVDGREWKPYLDFAGANAAIPLGYDRAEVTDAVIGALRSGSLLSLPSELEADASSRMRVIVPIEDALVRWVKTGSEATSAAIKLARAYTGCAHVLVGDHSYHGWHDWTQARRARDGQAWNPGPDAVMENGVPMRLSEHLWTFSYGGYSPDFSARRVAERIRNSGQRVAAIVVEPHRFMGRETQRDALLGLRALADEIGAVLILDEMVFGLRWATAGASQWCDVTPDLACYGKALGNGVPVACVVGRADILRRAEGLVSSTYGGDRLGLAAANAVLKVYEKEDVIGRLWANGRLFFQHFRLTTGDFPVPGIYLEGEPVHFRLVQNRGMEGLLNRVLVRCAKAGVLFHRSANNASAAMTEADVVRGAEVLGTAVMEATKEATKHAIQVRGADDTVRLV